MFVLCNCEGPLVFFSFLFWGGGGGGGGGGDEFLLLLLFYLTGESLKTFGYVSLSLVSSHLKWAHNFLSLEQPFFLKVVCIVFMCACIYVWETTFLEFLLVKAERIQLTTP